MEMFDAAIRKRLGEPLTPAELKEIGVDVPTPTYVPYEDDVDGTHPNVPDIEDVTPEDQDQYVGAEVNLPHGD